MMNRSNIEEANKHLQALYGRIQELEHVVAEQHEALISKDSFIQTKVKELSQQDAVIHKQVQQLDEKGLELQEKETRIEELERKHITMESELCKLKKQKQYLDRVLELVPDFRTLVNRFDAIATESEETYSDVIDQDGNQSRANSADDADATDNRDVFTKSDLSNTLGDESTTQQILRSFSSTQGRLEKFSISEDDETRPENEKPNTKELYF